MAKLTLAAVAASCVEVEIRLLGQVFKARPLSLLENAEILAVFPAPVPPMGDDPDGGSKAPKIPRPDDPEYRAADTRWYARYRAAAVAVAISKADPDQLDESLGRWTPAAGAEPDAATRKRNSAFLIKAVELLGQAVNADVGEAFGGVMQGADSAAEKAEKNSSRPTHSPETPASAVSASPASAQGPSGTTPSAYANATEPVAVAGVARAGVHRAG